jgi:excisionase family DNA binding protein
MKPNDTILIDGNEAPWLTKTEASKQLGVSERTIENYIAQNHLSTRPEQRRGKRPITLIDPDDVARILAERNRGAILPKEAVSAEHGTQLARINDFAGAFLAGIRDAVHAVPSPLSTPRAFLTLAAAAEYSGLPAGLLRRFIRRGELPCVRYGRDVYVKTRDLDELQFELATPEDERLQVLCRKHNDAADRADSATAFGGGSE